MLARLDRGTLVEAIQAQLNPSMLLSGMKPFVQAYLKIIDPDNLEQSLSKEDSSCAIIEFLEEEVCGSEERRRRRLVKSK